MASREPQRTEMGAIRWPEALKSPNQPDQLALVGETRRFRRVFQQTHRTAAPVGMAVQPRAPGCMLIEPAACKLSSCPLPPARRLQ